VRGKEEGFVNNIPGIPQPACLGVCSSSLKRLKGKNWITGSLGLSPVWGVRGMNEDLTEN